MSAEDRFIEMSVTTTEAFLADYRREHEAAGDLTAEQIDAYCAGFREAVGMYTEVFLRRAGKL